jgi:hypothetical protein
VLPPPAIPTEISWFCCHQQARSGKQQIQLSFQPSPMSRPSWDLHLNFRPRKLMVSKNWWAQWVPNCSRMFHKTS